MYRPLQLRDGSRVQVIMDNNVAKQISGRSFRGPGCRRAWNFFKFPTLSSFLNDSSIQTALQELIQSDADALAQDAKKHHLIVRRQMHYPEPVGWTALALEPIPTQFTYIQRWGKGKWALGVVPGRHKPAPLTNLIGMKYKLSHTRQGWQLLIYFIAPGPVFLHMHGNKSLQLGYVFYAMTHPGA